MNETGAHFAMEMHFNAFNATATGTETLHWHRSARGKHFASIVQRHMLIALKLKDRGVKPIAEDGRGGWFLGRTAMPAVIAEPFFGSNPIEMGHAMRNTEQLAAAYAAAIREIAAEIRKGGQA